MLSKKQDYTIADVKAYVQDISKANDSKELNLVELGFKVANIVTGKQIGRAHV